MKKSVAFVLGGGGARGALQVGALKALLEAGIQPDLLVGTSVGAINSTFMALNGVTLDSVGKLIEAWRDAMQADLLPANYLWLTVRTLFSRNHHASAHRMRDFFIQHGLSPDIRFGDIKDVRLLLVAADLNSSETVLYGTDPDEAVLDGVLASTALPPWVNPLEIDGRLLVDGGLVSVLPVEVAMAAGAKEIIALDLNDTRPLALQAQGFGSFIAKIVATVEHRQAELELALANARGVQVRHVSLRGVDPVTIWDFQQTETRIEQGYEITRQAIQSWKLSSRRRFAAWLRKDRRRWRKAKL